MPQPVLLDISRLFSRRDMQHDTGIDRVERGYLKEFSSNPATKLFCKFGRRFYIFDIENWNCLSQIPKPAQVGFFRNRKVHKTLSNLAKKSGVEQALSHYKDYAYVNVGHTSLPDAVWKKMEHLSIHKTIFIHDVIPLDFPQFSRQDKISVFKRKFAAWTKYADRIAAPSQYSADRIQFYSNASKNIIVAPLFVEQLALVSTKPEQNAFLILGTVEPRKNHEFLFKLWENLFQKHGSQTPQLWIIGARGWDNKPVFDFLENSPLMGRVIFDFGPISDDILREKMAQAKCLLFPSQCEGFGLPLYEAVVMNKPVIASNIPPFIEALGEGSPCIVDCDDVEAWSRAIMGELPHGNVALVSSWKAHIQNVLSC